MNEPTGYSMVRNQETGDRQREFSLEDLNISSSVDPYGQESMTISLDVHPSFGVADCQAVFDPKTRKWNLVTSSHVRLADGQRAKWKSSSKQLTPAGRPGEKTWTDALPRSDHIDFFLNRIDWAATSLGPLSSWPVSLQTCCNMVFADSRAAVIYWGPDKIAIGNAFMIDQVSGVLKKPADLLGKPFRDIWPELWRDFEPILDNIGASGVALDTINVNLFPTGDDGSIEEIYWSGSFLPIRGENGTIVGFYNTGTETTREVIQDRWTATLNSIAAPLDLVGASVWEHLFNALSENNRDFPMAFAYSASEDTTAGLCTLTLQRSFGLPSEGHPLVSEQCDIYEGTSGFMPFYRKAKAINQPLLLHKSDGVLSSDLMKGFESKGFTESFNSLAVIPIAASDRLLGLLVFGLNPRRRYDKSYEGFINSLARQTSATVASALDREEARCRAERLTRQLADSEKQIRDLAEYGPVGILRVGTTGKILWANPQFYEITGHSRAEDEHYELSFVDIVDPIDQSTSAGLWTVLVDEHKSVSAALRIKRKWRPPATPDSIDPQEQSAWILATAYPIIEDGQVTSVAASVVEISTFKWAEALQARVANDAKEAKRLQEAFIDVVSHEMRNPLSAIIQLADSITASFDDLEQGSNQFSVATEILQYNVESAKTILLCATHQKRIIDDVLTLSKLDSMMLSIAPVVVQLDAVIDSVLTMFQAEFETNSISVTKSLDNSYDENHVGWVYLDPSRLTQIFINLITNAVKFTKLENLRRIQIRVGASRERPSSFAGVRWFPTNNVKHDLTLGPEWGEGEPIYLLFLVVDTGKGLEQEEMTRLFNRFQQGTAKTHIKYGGSGLGLFISRELAEAQCGGIGVVSTPGKGSSFAFYIKAKRAKALPASRRPSSPTPPYALSRRTSRPEELPWKTISRQLTKLTMPCLLLVEDNLVNAQVLKRQLEKAGCQVKVANHGVECLDLLEKSRSWKGSHNEKTATEYDCILMDVEMPIMDGLTATKRIRQLESEGVIMKHMRIIATTANARAEQIAEILDAGADTVLPKPFRVKDLLDKIEGMRRAEA